MKQLAKIYIKNIAIDCILGVGEIERNNPQTVFVSLELLINATKAGQTDSIDDTVNYSTLSKKITAAVSQSQFHLLEALASMVLRTCLEDTRILHATVQVTKPTKKVTIEMSGGHE